jgi:hypothetical protein
MNRYHNISLQRMVIIASIYIGRYIAYIYNEWLPRHTFTLNGYYSIELQWTVTIGFTNNGW